MSIDVVFQHPDHELADSIKLLQVFFFVLLVPQVFVADSGKNVSLNLFHFLHCGLCSEVRLLSCECVCVCVWGPE